MAINNAINSGQTLGISSSPQFTGLNLSGLTPFGVLFTDSLNNLVTDSVLQYNSGILSLTSSSNVAFAMFSSGGTPFITMGRGNTSGKSFINFETNGGGPGGDQWWIGLTNTGTHNFFILDQSGATVPTPFSITQGSGLITIPSLTASQAVVTDGSQILRSLAYTSANTVNTLVERDGSGNFSAGTITATLNGNVATTLVTNNASYFPVMVAVGSSGNQAIDLSSGWTFNPNTITLNTNNIQASSSLQVGTTTNTAPVSVQGNGGTTGPTLLVASFMSPASPAAGNLFGIQINKSGTEAALVGVNKNTITGSVPANAVFISNYLTNGEINLGRGAGNGLPNTSDLLIDGNGLISMPQGGGANTTLTLGGNAGALTGTAKVLNFSGNYGAGNYINFGANGRNIGVFQGGNAFHTLGLDYNVAGTDYLYANGGSATGVALELTTAGGFNFNTAPSGANGAIATMTTQFAISNVGGVTCRGNIDITVAGQGLRVAEGSNAKQGIATLAGGTVTVANTNITANSRIMITCQVPGGVSGFLRISARTAGTSFTILSSNALDTSQVGYEIFEPG